MRVISTVLVLVLVTCALAQDEDEETCDDFECPVKGSYESVAVTGYDCSLFQMEVLRIPAHVGGTTPAWTSDPSRVSAPVGSTGMTSRSTAPTRMRLCVALWPQLLLHPPLPQPQIQPPSARRMSAAFPGATAPREEPRYPLGWTLRTRHKWFLL